MNDATHVTSDIYTVSQKTRHAWQAVVSSRQAWNSFDNFW